MIHLGWSMDGKRLCENSMRKTKETGKCYRTCWTAGLNSMDSNMITIQYGTVGLMLENEPDTDVEKEVCIMLFDKFGIHKFIYHVSFLEKI